MPYVGEIRMTYRLLRRISLGALGRRTLVMIGGVVLVVAGLALDRAGVVGAVVTAVLVSLLMYPMIEWGVWRGWRRTRRIAEQPWRYEVGESVVIITPQGRMEMPLTAFSRVRRGAAAWVLSTDASRSRVLVPREAFSADDAAAIDALLSDDALARLRASARA